MASPIPKLLSGLRDPVSLEIVSLNSGLEPERFKSIVCMQEAAKS